MRLTAGILDGASGWPQSAASGMCGSIVVTYAGIDSVAGVAIRCNCGIIIGMPELDSELQILLQFLGCSDTKPDSLICPTLGA